jgi:hypothetical protein
MTLLCTEPPREESGFGYYRRLSAMNAMWSWRDLAGMANVARTRSALVNSPDHVAAMLGLEPAWTQRALMLEQSCRKWRGLRRSRMDAICPACLLEAPYIRRQWEHAFVTACATHAVTLLDHCDACGEPLSQDRRRIDLCDCGRDLTALAAPPCTGPRRWLAALVESGGRTSDKQEPLLQTVDPDKLFLLVRTLCLFADPEAPPPRRNAASPKSVAEALELLRPLERLICDWPTAFESHVASRIAAGRTDARTLSSLLGAWYAHLKRACATGGLRPFLEAVVRVAAKEFHGALGLDAAGTVVMELTGYQRVAQAARELGVGRETLLKAAQSGMVAYRTSPFGTRGLVYEVADAEVEKVRARRLEWIGEEEAALLAEVPAAVLRHMSAAGVIVVDRGWRRDVFKGGPVLRASLVELLGRVNASASRQSIAGQRVVAWSELTSRRMGDAGAIQEAMRAAAAGSLVAVKRARHLGAVQFLRNDVQRYFGTPLLEAGMSIHQLSNATGWKWESIAHWIELGLLEAGSIVLRGQPCRVVAPEHLLRFRRTYIPVADLARAMGTTSTALSDQLSGLDIVGAKLLPNGARRGGLLRLAELGHRAVAGAPALHR